jgi:hypothetical protein
MERVLFRPLLVFRGETEAPCPGDLGEGMPSRWWVVQGKEVTGVTDECKQTMLATSKGDENMYKQMAQGLSLDSSWSLEVQTYPAKSTLLESLDFQVKSLDYA